MPKNPTHSFELLYKQKELEFQALLEIIRVINTNLPEDKLYKVFKFILSSKISLDKFALIVQEDETWICRVSFGTIQNYDQHVLSKQGAHDSVAKSTFVGLESFDKVIEVKHKNTVLAYVYYSPVPSANDAQRAKELEEHVNISHEQLLHNFIDVLSNIVIVAVENKRLVSKQRKDAEYREQVKIAQKVQMMLFPLQLPYTDYFKVMATYQPHHTIGGDYYDFIPLTENRFLLCIADVSGKGVPAAILMSNIQAALRVLIRTTTDLKRIIQELNFHLQQNTKQEGGVFITCFLCLYDPGLKRMEFINAGHNPPFLFTNGETKRLIEGTTILGVFDTLDFLELGTVENLDDFYMFSFTDGFTETYNEKGEPFGEELLESFLASHLHLEPKELHQSLITLLNTFKGKHDYLDDITLLSCQVKKKV